MGPYRVTFEFYGGQTWTYEPPSYDPVLTPEAAIAAAREAFLASALRVTVEPVKPA